MNHHEGDNIGGILKVDIALHSDFSGFDPAVFKEGKSWIKIPFKEESARLRFSKAESANGVIHSFKGELFIHHLREELETELNPFVGQKSVFRFTDMNNKIYIIGAPGTPVTVALDADTGAQYINENGSGYSFTVEQPFSHFTA